jgi:LacI family transcriptional regulator
MALGTYQALMEGAIKVPEEIALIGFNDIEFTSMKGIELTTIGQKKYEMGALAVKTLVERIEGRKGGPPEEIILEPELIIRKTCGFHSKGYQVEFQNRQGLGDNKSEARNPT